MSREFSSVGLDSLFKSMLIRFTKLRFGCAPLRPRTKHNDPVFYFSLCDGFSISLRSHCATSTTKSSWVIFSVPNGKISDHKKRTPWIGPAAAGPNSRRFYFSYFDVFIFYDLMRRLDGRRADRNRLSSGAASKLYSPVLNRSILSDLGRLR